MYTKRIGDDKRLKPKSTFHEKYCKFIVREKLQQRDTSNARQCCQNDNTNRQLCKQCWMTIQTDNCVNNAEWIMRETLWDQLTVYFTIFSRHFTSNRTILNAFQRSHKVLVYYWSSLTWQSNNCACVRDRRFLNSTQCINIMILSFNIESLMCITTIDSTSNLNETYS